MLSDPVLLTLAATACVVAAVSIALGRRLVPALCMARLDDDALAFVLLRVVAIRRIRYVDITGAGKMLHAAGAPSRAPGGPAAAPPMAVVITRRGRRGCIALTPTDPDGFIRELGEKVAAALQRERTPLPAGAR